MALMTECPWLFFVPRTVYSGINHLILDTAVYFRIVYRTLFFFTLTFGIINL